MSTARPTVTLTLAVGILFSCALILLHNIDARRGSAIIRESLYISSPAALKRMSLGYNGLLADIYWTRAVQYFGSHHARSAEEYDLLYPLLDITTQLDPKLIVAYRFGATFLAERPPMGAGQPEKAVQLVRNGIQHNPDDWHLYYDLGFLQAWNLHDYVGASRTFANGAVLPHTNPVMGVLAASYATKGGDISTAMLLWQTTYQNNQNEMIRQNALQHIQSIQSDEAVTELEEVISRYEEQTGHAPESFLNLVYAGMLKGTPLDPTGQPYELLPGGKIQVQDPDSLPFITKGAPPGWKRKTVPLP
ncbi:MAG TPA: hypothetical protein VKW78_20565 [Terriglobales bacterium]|nr:hypothetical protein [Terriglobales bacterium]